MGLHGLAFMKPHLQHWINMSFAIVSCCVTFIDFIVYAIVVGELSQSRYSCFFSSCFHGTNGGALAIYSILLALAILEFGIALATSIYCCKFGCTGCCNEEVTNALVYNFRCFLYTYVLIL